MPGPFNVGGPRGFGGVSVEPDGSALWTALGNSREIDPACDCLVDDAGYDSWSADSRTLYDASANVVVDGVSKVDEVVAPLFDTSCAVREAWKQ